MRALLRGALLVLAGVGLLACGADDLTDAAPATAVAVTAVRGPLEIRIPAEGTLEAQTASGVAVPRVPTGALKVKALVLEGSLVEPGDVIVEFDDTQLSIDLDSHRASFDSTNRQIDRTGLQAMIETGTIDVMRDVAGLERDYADEFMLVDDDIYSRLEILESEVQKDEAEATIVYAEAALRLRGEYYDIEKRILGVEKGQVEGNIQRLSVSLGQLVLRSPISGLIVYRKGWRGNAVGVGDTLWPGNLIMSIVDPASTELKAFVHEKDMTRLVEGAEADIVVDARPGRVFRGTLTSIADMARPIESGSPVKYSEVRIALEDAEPGLLVPGMKATARILAGRIDEAVILPRMALRGTPEKPYVLLRSGARSEERPVTLGPVGLVRVGVVDGLEGGETVLLGGDYREPPREPPRERRPGPPGGPRGRSPASPGA
jgi:multidrug efflux pump subunit AcrA (membrane-fusion protein)